MRDDARRRASAGRDVNATAVKNKRIKCYVSAIESDKLSMIILDNDNNNNNNNNNKGYWLRFSDQPAILY